MKCSKDSRRVLSAVFAATDLFDPMINGEALDSVSPTITARFVIPRPDRPPVQYQVEFAQGLGDDSRYEMNAPEWSREDRRDSRTPLQINMIRLDG